MKTVIELKNMRFFAHHGVFSQETVVGNEFMVNLHIEADLTEACKTDNIEHTINYASVYELVKSEMQKPSQLMENAAYRIMGQIKASFPQIVHLEVRIAKMNPPVGGEVERSEISLSC
ncbi:MAG: dihydroneopterin aldolase [Dysgonamonadaceae bacterium]|jgi:dihydroneopterin aldolase|nr:dihydroneopterin aldolase [Dysgonamonadaceae bacterium]